MIYLTSETADPNQPSQYLTIWRFKPERDGPHFVGQRLGMIDRWHVEEKVLGHPVGDEPVAVEVTKLANDT